MRRLTLIALVAALAALASAQSQQPPAPGGAAAPATPRVVSPEIHPDRTITFRLYAPRASEVVLQFDEWNPQPHPMAKGANGVWTVTIGPVDPEIYFYSFLVDGMKTIDMPNPSTKTGTYVDTSELEIPGNPPRYDELQNVPHGSVNMHTYMSTVTNRPRGLYVYVPAEYYTSTQGRYPVLYLFHGGNGAEADWNHEGRTSAIMDNLIAQKKALPMIVVMPNNYFTPPNPGGPGAGGGTNYDIAEKEIVNDIVPFVERTYRTAPGRENRAIAGLSAGGGTSISVGLKRLDVFATVCEYSTGMFGGVAGYAAFDLEKISPGFYKDPAATNKRLRLFYMSVGTIDPRMPFQTKVYDDFRAHKIQVTFKTFPGGHEWSVWRHSLADSAAMLFR
jgi:enterochelin esterase-like enzyme